MTKLLEPELFESKVRTYVIFIVFEVARHIVLVLLKSGKSLVCRFSMVGPRSFSTAKFTTITTILGSSTWHCNSFDLVWLLGVWVLGWILCDVWISLDILLCTASILSLCAISIDRFLAISRPISYSKMRRSKTLAVKIISGVWLLSLLITCPPILGW